MFYKTEDEAREAAVSMAKEEGLVDFYGKNCDDCGGWDGESKRCDCGNRRVIWEVDETKEGFYAYAQAY